MKAHPRKSASARPSPKRASRSPRLAAEVHETHLPPRHSNIDAPLPDLANADGEIVAENIRVAAALYYASMLEATKLFLVVDQLVSLFSQGLLPIGRGRTGKRLYQLWKARETRLTAKERRSLFVRVLGTPDHDAGSNVAPNREFRDRWLCFISSVAAFTRPIDEATKLLTNPMGRVSRDTVQRSARALAANLSQHGYGIIHFAAAELNEQIKEAIRLLSDPEIKQAMGSRDMWQVIEQVSQLYLGGVANTAHHRSLAASGTTIISWLANHRAQIVDARSDKILKAIASGKRRPPLRNPVPDPTDHDLVRAVEQWLAISDDPVMTCSQTE